MNAFLYELKGQATILNGLMLLLICAFIFYRYHKYKLAIGLSTVTVLLWLLTSTYYLPHYLADKIERTYPPISLPVNVTDSERVWIHVLGSGCTLDKRLPATAQLGLVSLGRLTEGIRIFRTLKNGVIVCSGFSSLGLETQAQVTRRAAITLGVDDNRLMTLNLPGTTLEEAKELGKQIPKNSKLIIVTDAIHMPRAMSFFKGQGFNPIAAPTNYIVNEGADQATMKWWPSIGNISLMNYIIHEFLADIKASLFH